MSAVLVQLDEARRMSDAQYQAERASIAARVGNTDAEARALRDQALATLFHRSGWTHDQLAKVENCSRPTITRRLKFGAFLAFVPSGHIPRNLTERSFRSYWLQTDKNEKDRGLRFSRIIELMFAPVDVVPDDNVNTNKNNACDEKPTKVPKRHAVHRKMHHRKPNKEVERAIAALEGICIVLDSIDVAHLDNSRRAEWAADFKRIAAQLSKFSRGIAHDSRKATEQFEVRNGIGIGLEHRPASTEEVVDGMGE